LQKATQSVFHDENIHADTYSQISDGKTPQTLF